MTAVAVLVSLLLAAALVATGTAKVTGNAPVLRNLERIGADRYSRTIGGAELALAATLVIGVFAEVFRLVGALGVLGLTAGAVVFHLRAGDPPDELVPAVAVGVLALVVVLATG